MRICHFLSSDTYAGIEQYVDEISNEQSHNHQVIIITNRSILKKFNNNVSKIGFSSLGRNSPIGLLRLFFLIKEISPDIIHTHAAKPTFMINKIKKLFNAKHVATIHGAKKNLDEFDKADFAIANFAKAIRARARVPEATFSKAKFAKAKLAKAKIP